MDYLPLFAELKEKPVLVIGGGDIAMRSISGFPLPPTPVTGW